MQASPLNMPPLWDSGLACSVTNFQGCSDHKILRPSIIRHVVNYGRERS